MNQLNCTPNRECLAVPCCSQQTVEKRGFKAVLMRPNTISSLV